MFAERVFVGFLWILWIFDNVSCHFAPPAHRHLCTLHGSHLPVGLMTWILGFQSKGGRDPKINAESGEAMYV